MKLGKIVCIEWEDAYSDSGSFRKQEPIKSMLCHTVGFVGKKTKEHVVVTSMRYDVGDQKSAHIIPRKMIRRIIKLRE